MTASGSTRKLRVFLCHSSGDKPAVRNLYRRLCVDSIAAWLDTEKLSENGDFFGMPQPYQNSQYS